MNYQKLIQSSLVSIFLIALFISAYAQDTPEPLITEMEMITLKKADGSRIFKCKLADEEGNPTAACEINFYMAGETAILLGTGTTADDGWAKISLPETFEWIKNHDLFIPVTSEFEGNEQYISSSAELMFKDVKLQLEFIEQDSVKMIYLSAVVLGQDGEELPVADQDVYLYVPRMFSQLKIGDGWLEEDGTGSLEFPLDVIGDTIGNIEIIAKIEEHEEYGNVEASAINGWAVKRYQHPREMPSRELWTPIAPLWMIITLIIMLSGVWGHYIYAVVQLIMINRSARKNQISNKV